MFNFCTLHNSKIKGQVKLEEVHVEDFQRYFSAPGMWTDVQYTTPSKSLIVQRYSIQINKQFISTQINKLNLSYWTQIVK